MWLQLQGKRLTHDRLEKWGMIVQLECVLCNAHPETGDQLFMSFVFTKPLWDRLSSLASTEGMSYHSLEPTLVTDYELEL